MVSARHPATSLTRIATLFYPFLLSILTSNAFAQPQDCPSDSPFDTQVTVKQVIDGDTVLLTNGQKLRFAAINAPELAHDNKPAEDGAEQARQALLNWLPTDSILQLRFDQQKYDHYQRLLAHPFLADGRNLQAMMLEQGLAAHIVEPPSLWAQNCYAHLELLAQRQTKGMWGSERFASIAASQLSSRTHGFYRVHGRVEKVWSTNRTTWLKLSDKLTLRIEKQDLKYFKHFSPEALRSHQVEVKGWIFPYLDGLNIRIQHPGALRILD